VRDSLRVALIEGGDLSEIRRWSPDPDQFSNRVSSITNASKGFLKGKSFQSIGVYTAHILIDIGAWEHVDTTRTAPIEEMQASYPILLLIETTNVCLRFGIV
jgi:ubiquinone biosynthesis monooxygenase Coq6